LRIGRDKKRGKKVEYFNQDAMIHLQTDRKPLQGQVSKEINGKTFMNQFFLGQIYEPIIYGLFKFF
jgi:hypothetical protein